jgi:uncharacterized membrane protein (UPF0127 family)
MQSSSKSILTIGAVIVIVAASLYYFYTYSKNTSFTPQDAENGSVTLNLKNISIGETTLKVRVAKTAQERAVGLSNVKKIGRNEGMLFVFNVENTRPAFWMKDMLFPIDIIWINDGKITQIHESVSAPENGINNKNLHLYKPNVGIDLVLEVNAGFSKDNNISVGDTVNLSEVIN